MGILDKIVNDRLSEEQERNKKALDRLSRDELEKRRQEDFAAKSRSYVSQALTEFPDACKKLGINGLPFLIRKMKPSMFSRFYDCIWGYRLCYVYDEPRLRLIRSLDGTYYMGMEDFRQYEGKREVLREFRPAAIPTPNYSLRNYHWDPQKREYSVQKDLATFADKISFEEAVSFVCEDLVDKATKLNVYRSPAFKDIHEAYEKDDPERAVTGLFAYYIQRNQQDTDNLANNELLLKFFKSL